MGSGNYPNYADCIKHEFVKEECPYLYDELITLLNESDMSFDAFADCISNYIGDATSFSIDEDNFEKLNKCWETLQKLFKRFTGLELSLVHHTKDDRGVIFDGGSFSVEGVYGFTPAGEKYKNKIERKVWNKFG